VDEDENENTVPFRMTAEMLLHEQKALDAQRKALEEEHRKDISRIIWTIIALIVFFLISLYIWNQPSSTGSLEP